MLDRSRWRTPPQIDDFIADELASARKANDPWTHLERAHIVSQPWAGAHARVHAVMLATALRQCDPRETIGQLVRLAVAAPGSLTGRYPTGNTGRSTMALTRTHPSQTNSTTSSNTPPRPHPPPSVTSDAPLAAIRRRRQSARCEVEWGETPVLDRGRRTIEGAPAMPPVRKAAHGPTRR